MLFNIKFDKNKMLNFESEKGSSLFTRIFLEVLDEEIFTEMTDKLNSLLKKYSDTLDDRAYAIIGALSIENELDTFLSTWIKKYKVIIYDRDFTFSSKVNLAISLNLIPVKILNAIEPIRKIRNIFAHNLEIDTFEKARKESEENFEMLYNKLESFNFPDDDIEDDKDAFFKLILLIIVGIHVYTKHIIIIQDYIWNSSNLINIIRMKK